MEPRALLAAVALATLVAGARADEPDLQVDTAEPGPTIALTFDDGPSRCTRTILRALQDADASATFFMVGRWAAQGPGVVQDVVDAGMLVANHTQDHPRLSTCCPAEMAREVASAQDVLFSITGTWPRWFRPPCMDAPEGLDAILRANGLTLARATVWPRDWDPATSAEEIVERVLTGAHPGGVVLLHDGGPNCQATAEAVPLILEGLLREGYQVVDLDHLEPAPRGEAP